jgi:hypothetical protein
VIPRQPAGRNDRLQHCRFFPAEPGEKLDQFLAAT